MEQEVSSASHAVESAIRCFTHYDRRALDVMERVLSFGLQCMEQTSSVNVTHAALYTLLLMERIVSISFDIFRNEPRLTRRKVLNAQLPLDLPRLQYIYKEHHMLLSIQILRNDKCREMFIKNVWKSSQFTT